MVRSSLRAPIASIVLGLLPVVFGTAMADYRCLYGQTGCGSDFGCSSGSGVCPESGNWIRKTGARVPYNMCVSRKNSSCDLVNVLCHVETHYSDYDCVFGCELVNTLTPGCY